MNQTICMYEYLRTSHNTAADTEGTGLGQAAIFVARNLTHFKKTGIDLMQIIDLRASSQKTHRAFWKLVTNSYNAGMFAGKQQLILKELSYRGV